MAFYNSTRGTCTTTAYNDTASTTYNNSISTISPFIK